MQLPAVKPVAVRLRADKAPVNVGALVMLTAGVAPAVTDILPTPVTPVTEPPLHEVAVVVSNPPVEA